ncbi:MAG TPA: type II secretion system protein GspN [Candidatus Tectomicrobia bacterium]
MVNTKRLILHVLAYTFYGLVVCLVLLYVMFPYNLLRQRVIEGFSVGELQLAIARLGPDFPPGVRLQNVRLLGNQAGSPSALIHLETLRAHPDLFALFSRTLNIQLNATLYDGTLQGNVRAAMVHGAPAWETLQVQFTDLSVERHPLVQKEGQAFLRGRLSGDLSVTFNSDGLMQQGLVTLRPQPVVFVSNQTLPLPLSREVSCSIVNGRMQLTPGQWQIDQILCRGTDLSIEVRGLVRWQRPLAASVLELRVRMSSVTAYKQEIDLIGGLVQRRPDRRGELSFSIRGTLQQLHYGA